MKQLTILLFLAIASKCIAQSPANYVIMNQFVNDMVYDSLDSQVLVSIPSTDNVHGNSIGFIDPESATLSGYYFVGSEPRPIAITDDMKYLYVGLDGAKNVKKFNISTHNIEQTFTIGSDNFNGPYFAGNISCQPGTDSVIAVARRAQGYAQGVCIYKNGIQLPDTISSYPTTIDLVHYYSPTALIGYNNSNTGYDLSTMSVDSQGVRMVSHMGNLFGGFDIDFCIHKDLALSDNGTILDLSGGTPSPLAQITLPTTQGFGPVRSCFDTGSNLVCFATKGYWNDSIYIFRYNATTYLKYDQIRVNGFSGNVNKIICWGKSKYMVSTADGKLLVINGILPTVTINVTDSLTSSSVKCIGEITSEGSSNVNSRGVCWSTTGKPTVTDSSIYNGSGTGQFSVTINHLKPNTKYYVRAFATNSSGTSYGNEVSFTTLANLPTLMTNEITGLTATTAIGGGEVTDDGYDSMTARGVCWSTSENPTITDNSINNGVGKGQFSVTINNLTPNTKYYVRAFATNSAGTSYGNEVSFTTLAIQLPALTTNEITEITATKATSGGEVTNNGNDSITARGVCWSTTTPPTITDSLIYIGAGTGQFSATINNLTPDTKYYVRAFATNSAGTSYGNEVSFITLVATGINQNTENNLTIFLNPENNILSINGLLGKSNISIFDMNGRLMMNKQLISNQINLSSLERGVYIVRIQTENGYLVKKIIIR